MKTIPTIEENPNGLHQRFIITKNDGKEVDPSAEYFVLRLDLNSKDRNHISACRKAINTYADAIEATIPQLASDLRERYPLL